MQDILRTWMKYRSGTASGGMPIFGSLARHSQCRTSEDPPKKTRDHDSVGETRLNQGQLTANSCSPLDRLPGCATPFNWVNLLAGPNPTQDLRQVDRLHFKSNFSLANGSGPFSLGPTGIFLFLHRLPPSLAHISNAGAPHLDSPSVLLFSPHYVDFFLFSLPSCFDHQAFLFLHPQNGLYRSQDRSALHARAPCLHREGWRPRLSLPRYPPLRQRGADYPEHGR